jgi:hypothetical protein
MIKLRQRREITPYHLICGFILMISDEDEVTGKLPFMITNAQKQQLRGMGMTPMSKQYDPGASAQSALGHFR